MLQKFKMTTFSAVLGLVGFMVFSAAPVFADAVEPTQENFQECKDMPWKKGKKKKMKCFRELAESNPLAGLYYSGRSPSGHNSSTEIDEMYEDEFVICKGMTWGEEKGDKSAKKNCYRDLAQQVTSCNDEAFKIFGRGKGKKRGYESPEWCRKNGKSNPCKKVLDNEHETFESALVEATTRGFCSPLNPHTAS